MFSVDDNPDGSCTYHDSGVCCTSFSPLCPKGNGFAHPAQITRIQRGDWNGAGAHCNYSIKSMRSDGGFEVIKKAIEKLGLRHKEHIAAYGEGNERRLTGKKEHKEHIAAYFESGCL